MCREVLLGSRIIETIGELTSLLGRRPPLQSGYDLSGHEIDELCLCPVNHEASAALLGRRAYFGAVAIHYLTSEEVEPDDD